MSLTPRQSALLAQMRADNRRAGAPFVTTEYWDAQTAQFDRLFEAAGINEVENEYFNTRFSGLQPNDPRLYRWFLWTYRNAVKRRDSLDLLNRIPVTLSPQQSESSASVSHRFGEPFQTSRLEELNGKIVSPDLLFSIDDFYNLIELEPRVATEDIVVCDLGAGWGRLGYVLTKANPRARYVVLDIPETLLIASEYLPTLLRPATVGQYAETREIRHFDRDVLLGRQLWFLGCHDLLRFATGSADVIINVASFMEMTPSQVNAYLELFDRVALGGCVYLRNAWTGMSSGFRDLKLPEGWQQLFARNSLATCDFYEAGYRVS